MSQKFFVLRASMLREAEAPQEAAELDSVGVLVELRGAH